MTRLFILNIANEINKNASSSIYLLDSINLCHAKLGHVNLSYLKKINSLGLIFGLILHLLINVKYILKLKLLRKYCIC